MFIGNLDGPEVPPPVPVKIAQYVGYKYAYLRSYWSATALMRRGQRGFTLSTRMHAAFIAAIIVIQGVINAGYTLHSSISGRYRPRAEDIPSEIFMYAVICVIWYMMFRAIISTYGRSIYVKLSVNTASAVTAMLLFAIMLSWTWVWFGRAAEPPSYRILVGTFLWSAPMFVIWALGLTAFVYALESRERERLLAQSRELAQQAQLLALRYQINPHFLYNSLNSISALILDRHNARAEKMVMGLSRFLRASLATDALQDVLLKDEIELQRDYLSIEKIRFQDRLYVEIDLPDHLTRALVPSFILQPLVENVIQHGLGSPGTVTTLQIRASGENGRLILEVRNNRLGTPGGRSGGGVGLGNVRERLIARYGEACDFSASPQDNGDFLVRIEMPLLLSNS